MKIWQISEKQFSNREWLRQHIYAIEMPVVVKQQRRRIVTAQQPAEISERRKKYCVQTRKQLDLRKRNPLY